MRTRSRLIAAWHQTEIGADVARSPEAAGIVNCRCEGERGWPQDDHKLIAHNYGAVMAVSAEPDGYLNTVEDLGFFKSDRTDIRIFQTQHTRWVVAVEWPVGKQGPDGQNLIEPLGSNCIQEGQRGSPVRT